MDELFKELEEEMTNCKSEMKTFSQGLSTCLTMYSMEDKSLKEEKKNLYQTSIAPGFSFPKDSRFIQPKDEPIQIPLSYSIDVIMVFIIFQILKAQPNVIISKTQRFVEPKQLDQPVLQPNFDFVKKKIQSALITESRIDDTSTQASFSTVGPGSYEPKFLDLSNQKQSGWAKSHRFPKQESNEQTPINPNYDAVKPAIKVPKIAKPIKKNKMLIQKEEIEKMNEQLRLSQYRKRPLEIDMAIRPNPKTVVIKQAHTDIQSHPLGSKMRRFLIRKLIEDLQLVNPGPGQYEMQEEHQPCMVVWRSHSTERRIPPERPTPGPDYYYSKDDLIKQRTIQVVFGKEERIKVIKKKDLDMRPDLDIVDDLVRQNAPQPVRWDVKPTLPRVTFEMDRAAIGYYDIKNDQVEPRVLGTKIAPLNEKNDRINVIDPTKGRDFNDYDEQLYPSLDPIKPAIKTFKYHQESDIHPQHVPDKELYPEKHKFYDVNLDVVREELVKDIALAGQKGRGLKEWLDYVDDLKMFQGYMDRRNKMPHLGEYDVSYGQVDKDAVAVNFNRYVEIDHEPITKPDGAVDGDNLILHPDKPQKHIANIDFEKQSDPRQEDKVPEQELLLNVDYTQVKPRVKGIPDFEKQLERPEGPQQKEQELYLEVNHKQVEKRVVGDANFEKQQERHEDIRYQHKVDDKPLLLEAKLQSENKRTAVQMNSKTKRFLYKKESDKEKMPGAVNLSKLERGERVVRPNVPQVRIGSKQNININNKK